MIQQNWMSVNLAQELRKYRKRDGEQSIINTVNSLLGNHTNHRSKVIEQLQSGGFLDDNHLNEDLLDEDFIFSLEQIKKLCIDYRLRFLDSSMYSCRNPI